MIKDVTALGIDHLRIRCVRDGKPGTEPTEDQRAMISPKIAKLIGNMRGLEAGVDLNRIRVGEQYRCWMGPLIMVVDPAGDAYPCLNYYNQPDGACKALGSFRTDRLRNFWTPDAVTAFLRRVSPHACNADTSCDCRLVTYQTAMERHLRAGTPFPPCDLPPELEGFV
jgi:hypothetical protein